MYLQQLGNLAVIHGGARHPMGLLVEDWLKFGLTPELMLGIIRAQTNAQVDFDLVPDHLIYEARPVDAMEFQMSCEFLGTRYSIQEAEYVFFRCRVDAESWNQKFLRRYNNFENRYKYQFDSLEMARFYLLHRKHVDAAAMLSDAPDHLAEWIEKGYEATNPRTAPLSIMGVIWHLAALGETYAGLQQYESADAMFQAAIASTPFLTEPVPG